MFESIRVIAKILARNSRSLSLTRSRRTRTTAVVFNFEIILFGRRVHAFWKSFNSILQISYGMIKTRSFIIFSLVFILYTNLVYATEPSVPCFTSLPSYVNEFHQYYEEVEIINDSCYPGFTFTIPSTYSDFNLSYHSDDFSFSFPYGVIPETIEDLDREIREKIILIESCPDFQPYFELVKDNEAELKYLIGYQNFLDVNSNCKDHSFFVKTNKIINTFLDSGKLGGYVACSRETASFGKIDSYYKNIDVNVDVSCDGINERLLINAENDEVVEAYFLNHKNIPYRQIHPKDISIRDRTTVWEPKQNSKNFLMLIAAISTVLLVILIIYLIRKKHKLNYPT